MSETGKRKQKCKVESIITLLFLIFNMVYSGDLIFEKGDGEVVIIFTEDGDLVPSVAVYKTDNTSNTGDLIICFPYESSENAKIVFSEDGVRIENELQTKYDQPDNTMPDGLKFKNVNKPGDYDVQAAVCENGDLILRKGVEEYLFGGPQPNYVKVFEYQSPDDQDPITRKTFYELGKVVQNQQKLSTTRSLVEGYLFDKADRPTKNLKIIPTITFNKFYPMSEDKLINASNYYYNELYPENDDHAYSEVNYYPDPLERGKEVGNPGRIYSLDEDNHVKTWYFGVPGPDYTGPPVGTYLDGDRFIFPPRLNDEDLDNILPQLLENVEGEYFLTVTHDPNGNYTQQIKDKFGNVIRKWAYVPTDYSGYIVNQVIRSKIKYDILERVYEAIPPPHLPDQSKNITSTINTYNLLGQLEVQTLPDKGAVNYTYNNEGQLNTVTKAAGEQDEVHNTYFYDNLGRLHSIENKNGKVVSKNYYDVTEDIYSLNQYLPGNPINIDLVAELDNLQGRLVAEVSVVWDDESVIEDKSVAEVYSYDNEGRISARYKFIAKVGWNKISYEYDIQSKLIKKELFPQYQSGTGQDPIVLRYYYDNFGRLTEIIKGNSNNKIVSYIYAETGQLIQKTFYNGSSDINSISYTYTIRDWIKEINSDQIYSESIDYNGFFNGTINAITHNYTSGNTVTLDYDYDGLYRLTKVTANTGNEQYHEAFSYDHIGKIIQKRRGANDFTGFTDTYTYKTGKNQLRHVTNKQTDDNYDYDNRGNLIKDDSKKIKNIDYDWREMPISFNFQNGERWLSRVDMVYDNSSNRVLKKEYTEIVPARGVAYVHNDLVFESENVGEEDESYHLTYFNINSVGKIEYESGTRYFYIKDHLGSIRSVINSAGNCIEENMYDSYGKIFPVTRSIDEIREKFTGKEFDDEGAVEDETDGMELYYFGARFYDPDIGGFTSTDPMMEFWNPFSYCGGNPINFIDPTGLTVYATGNQQGVVDLFGSDVFYLENDMIKYNEDFIGPLTESQMALQGAIQDVRVNFTLEGLDLNYAATFDSYISNNYLQIFLKDFSDATRLGATYYVEVARHHFVREMSFASKNPWASQEAAWAWANRVGSAYTAGAGVQSSSIKILNSYIYSQNRSSITFQSGPYNRNTNLFSPIQRWY